jgi:integrase
VILSLTTGIRTEEARALRWDQVDLDGDPDARTPVPPNIAVWRSVRLHGDTKKEKSRRTLALPQNAVTALREHRKWQTEARLTSNPRQEANLCLLRHGGRRLTRCWKVV